MLGKPKGTADIVRVTQATSDMFIAAPFYPMPFCHCSSRTQWTLETSSDAAGRPIEAGSLCAYATRVLLKTAHVRRMYGSTCADEFGLTEGKRQWNGSSFCIYIGGKQMKIKWDDFWNASEFKTSLYVAAFGETRTIFQNHFSAFSFVLQPSSVFKWKNLYFTAVYPTRPYPSFQPWVSYPGRKYHFNWT